VNHREPYNTSKEFGRYGAKFRSDLTVVKGLGGSRGKSAVQKNFVVPAFFLANREAKGLSLFSRNINYFIYLNPRSQFEHQENTIYNIKTTTRYPITLVLRECFSI
jgi:hypothetical protein